jgi:DNA-binding SARP family transcriptional activator
VASPRLSARERSVREAGGRQPRAPRLLLHLEGGFSLCAGRRICRLPLSSQRVLAFLALHERSLLRVYVAGALWPGSNESRAAASLRTSIWRLQQIGGRPVVASASHLGLGDNVVVDVRQTIDAARTVLNGKPARVCSREFELLVEAHDLLPDWYDEWVIMEREHIREQRVRALEALCVELTAAGEYPNAARAGLAAVACEPLRESSHRALIAVHIAEGNPGEAVRRYAEYAALLKRKLDLAPSSRMRDMVEAVMASNAASAGRSTSDARRQEIS